MGQKVGALSFRSGIFGLWKIKSYPNNPQTILLKKFNLYKIVQSFIWKMNMELILYKSYLRLNYIYLFIYTFKYHKFYKRLRIKKRRKKKSAKINKGLLIAALKIKKIHLRRFFKFRVKKIKKFFFKR